MSTYNMNNFDHVWNALKDDEEENETASITASSTFNNCWESYTWFIEAIIPLIGLGSNDVFVDAGSGKGYVCFQMAHENVASQVYGVEIGQARFDLGLVGRHNFSEFMENQRNVTPIEFINADFRGAEAKSIMDKATIVYVAVDYMKSTANFLKNLLDGKEPGFRLITSIPVIDFKDSVKDPRVQVLQLNPKPIPREDNDDKSLAGEIVARGSSWIQANTTKQATFMPFQILTIRNAKIAPIATSTKKFKNEQKVFFPLQIGLDWITFEGWIVESNSTCSLVETMEPPWSKLIASLWLPNNEISAVITECRKIVIQRNTPQAQAPPPTKPPPTIPPGIAMDMTFVINKLLTPSVAKKLDITPENVIFLGNGFDSGSENLDNKFLVLDDGDVQNYFENGCHRHPCKFRKGSNLKYQIPSEGLTRMSRIYGNKSKTKHQVHVTNADMFSTKVELPIGEMEKYLAKPVAERGHPRAMTYITVATKDRYCDSRLSGISRDQPNAFRLSEFPLNR